MDTKVFSGTEKGAGTMIKNGALVAVPTETVYGLAGNGLNPEAVERIYEVKGRPVVKPLSLMVPGKEAMHLYCDPIPEEAVFLAEKFWPGPLTIVLKSRDIVPNIVRAGGETVGLRCPDSVPTLAALQEAGIPFAAPSANPSGEPSPKTAEEVSRYFNGKIEGIIDGGECRLGRESTLIDLSATPFRILREASLSFGTLADALVERMTVIGITGPSGCGKTSALDFFAQSYSEKEALTIDCDALYHTMLKECTELNAAILNEFPEAFDVFFTDGKKHVNRQRLGTIVFSDKSRLRKLNEITHSFIVLQVKSMLREHAMNGGKIVLIDASELLDSEIKGLCSKVIAVLAPEDQRLKRIIERDHISKEDALARIHAQHDDSYYEKGADIVIRNHGSFDEFRSDFLNILYSF